MNGIDQGISDQDLLQEVSSSIQHAIAWDVLVANLPVLIVAFLVTLLVTPLVRRLAISADIVDRPLETRKIHTRAVPYLGGVAVFCGLLVGLLLSYFLADQMPIGYRDIPPWVIIGLIIITFTGLLDDVTECDSWVKVAGQLIAAAGLALSNVGTRVAAGLMQWIGWDTVNEWTIPSWGDDWSLTNLIGGFIIGIFVLGGCNATNLIDGLDGLLSGVVAIFAIGILILSLFMVEYIGPNQITTLEASMQPEEAFETGVTLSGARVAISLALLGAVLGFLPHNFNPATIFLGDCGSLLLGYMCVVIILMLGEAGQTHLVLAGLIIFSIPIIDTLLAIVRRKVRGQLMWDPDARHMHHLLKARLGSVKKAVLALYAMGAGFAVLGAGLGALILVNDMKFRVVYIVFIVMMCIVVYLGVRMGLSGRRANMGSNS